MSEEEGKKILEEMPESEVAALLADPLGYLKAKSTEAGTNITRVCAEAGIDRFHVQGWKDKPPKTVQTLSVLLATIARIKSDKPTLKKV